MQKSPEKEKPTDCEVLSGSPQTVNFGGRAFELRMPPRRWAREMRAHAVGIGNTIEGANGDGTKTMDAAEQLIDRILSHPSLEDDREWIEDNATDEDCAIALGLILEQVTDPLAQAVSAAAKTLTKKTKTRTRRARR